MGLFGCEYLETRGMFFPEYVCKRTMRQIDSRTAQDVCMTSRYADCIDYKNGSMCFITTSVCLTMGKPDDCEELTEMRRFRDKWLRFQPDGPSLIEEYYAVAPGIVEKIDQQPGHEKIYADIYDKYIQPCVENIKIKNYAASKEIYVKMVETLKARYA